jgi:pimeloyl-ACP methyl ester carboxylesterase
MIIKQLLTTSVLAVFISNLSAQVGHTTITFNDPNRTGGFGTGGGTGRQIQTEIYYPATTTADNVPVVGTNLPIIVFGHGFSMGWDAYANVWQSLTSEGYVIAFPRTEGSLSPSHGDFGKDIALLVDKMQNLNITSSSLFFGKLASTSAIMGHSMGGGSSFLAGANNTAITTMVTFAAANTNPSSISASRTVTVPNLIITGQNDCVAPPANHQNIIYDSLISNLKTEVTIKGGGHCYFANNNFNCSFGEGTCTPNPTITRAEQQDVTLDYTKIWLRRFLKNDCSAGTSFQDSLISSNRILHRQSNPINCSSVGLNLYNKLTDLKVYPNPANQYLNIESNIELNFVIILDLVGRVIYYSDFKNNKQTIDIKNFDNGIYYLKAIDKSGSTSIIKWLKK